MNKLISFLFVFSFVSIANAQDTIYFWDGRIIEAKIHQIDIKTITYSLTLNPLGPKYKEAKNNIKKLKYANGEIETFEDFQPPVKRDSIFKAYGKNHIAICILPDAFYYTLNLSYERIFLKGYLGTRISAGYNFSPKWGEEIYSKKGALSGYWIHDRNILFRSALDINFYPGGQGKVKFFTGFTFPYFTFKYTTYEYVFVGPFQKEKQNYTNKQGSAFGILPNFGIIIQPVKYFTLTGFIGFGQIVRKYIYNEFHGSDYENTKKIETALSTGVTIGVKF